MTAAPELAVEPFLEPHYPVVHWAKLWGFSAKTSSDLPYWPSKGGSRLRNFGLGPYQIIKSRINRIEFVGGGRRVLSFYGCINKTREIQNVSRLSGVVARLSRRRQLAHRCRCRTLVVGYGGNHGKPGQERAGRP